MTPAAKGTMIVGGLLTLGGPAIGLVGTVRGLISGFDTLGQKGVASAESLANSVGTSLIATIGGVAVGAVGLLIFIAGLGIWLGTRSSPRPVGGPQAR